MTKTVLHGYMNGHTAQIYGMEGVCCEIQHGRIRIGIEECTENPLVDGYADNLPTGGV